MTAPNPTAVTFIYDLAAGILVTAADALTVAGIAPPDLQYVTDGDIVHDCEELVVVVERIMAGVVGRPRLEPVMPGIELYAEIAVECVRCVPVLNDAGSPPTPTALGVAAQALLIDRWILLGAFMNGRFSQPHQQVMLIDHNRVGPSGGIGGSSLRFAIQL